MIETWILEWKKKTIFQNSQRIIYVEKISAKTDDQRQNIYTCVEHVGEANQASKQEKTETYFGSKINDIHSQHIFMLFAPIQRGSFLNRTHHFLIFLLPNSL